MSKMRQPVYAEDAIARGYGIIMLPGALWRSPAYGWDQILTPVRGSFKVESGADAWRISPGQALLIPGQNDHDITMVDRCEMKAAFLLEQDIGSFRLVALTPLLRELILRISSLGALSRKEELDRSLVAVTSHELKNAPAIPLEVAWPTAPVLKEAGRFLISDPLKPPTVADAAARAHVSQRTLERRFQKEVGMGVAQWRRELRLLSAAQEVLSGALISQVAFDAGYSTASAFVFAFKRKFGMSPTRFRRRYAVSA